MARRAKSVYRIVDVIYDDLPEEGGGGEVDPEKLNITLSTGEQLTKCSNGNFSSDSKVVVVEDIIYSTEEPTETLKYLINNNIIEIEVVSE